MLTKPVRSYFFAFTLSILVAPASFAAWTLDNDQSSLSFISIKATDIGEVHTFTHLDGGITDSGEVAITINLASVETFIPIRNERMQEMLFETKLFPSATINASLEDSALNALAPGMLMPLDINASLRIKDRSIALTLKVMAARLSSDKVIVTSRQPVLLTAASVGLTEGVEKLRAVANLPNISQVVPVSFVLTFKQDAPG